MTQYAQSCYLQADRGQKLNCTAGLAYNSPVINSKCMMLSRGVTTHTIPLVFRVCVTAEVAATEMCPNAETADTLSRKC